MLLSPSTGCPTKWAQSILWGNAGEYLSSKDVHSQTLGAAQPQQSQASRNGWDDGALLVLVPHPGSLACPPRQLLLLIVPA